MTCRSAVSLALKFRDINHYKAYKLQRNINNFSYLLSKYLGMFTGFLEKISKFLAVRVGRFTKECLCGNWSKLFQHTSNDGSVAENGIPW